MAPQYVKRLKIRFFSNLVGEKGPRIQGVKCFLPNDFTITLSILATAAIFERMSPAALLVCNVK